MKKNKGITLTSLVIYIALIFVVLAILMRITTYFNENIREMADVSFETEFNKLNIYLLDESKKSNNGIQEITEDGAQITFSNGNKYTYNAENKTIYLNNNIKICENIESCLFGKNIADNGKDILVLTIKIGDIEKTVNYTIKNTIQNESVLPAEYQEVEYIESTGTQYIDTGVKSKSNIKLETSIKGNYDTSAWYGGRTGSYIGIYNYNGRFDWMGITGEGKSIVVNPSNNEWHNISHGKELIIDNQLIIEYNDTEYTTDFNIYLFAGNNNGKIANYSTIKMKETKIYENDNIVRNLIPCYRKSDNVVGLYDTVNNVFYTNAGTGTFLKGNNIGGEKQQPSLPAIYQEVKYIESTGTQYIDTGVAPTLATGFALDLTILDGINSSGKRLFGSSYRNNGNWGGIMLATYNAFEGGQLRYGTTSNVDPKLISNNRIQINFINKHYTSSTGADVYVTDTTLQPYGSLYIFNVNTDSSTTTFSSAKLYSAKIYEGDLVIRNFIPCYRKSDNVVGLYDTVNNVFYTNAGTGKFLKGEDKNTVITSTDDEFIREDDYNFNIEERIVLPVEYQQVEYIQSTGTQYINTEYYPDAKTNAKYKVSVSQYNASGPHILSSKNYYFPFFRDNANAYVLGRRGTDSEFKTTAITPSINTIYEYKAYWNGKVVINNQELGRLTITGEADTTPLYIGAYGGNLNYSGYILNGKIYYCKIYNGNTLVRNFVPCYRKSDNVVGLYDAVNNVFYTNAGTGVYTAGAAVN